MLQSHRGLPEYTLELYSSLKLDVLPHEAHFFEMFKFRLKNGSEEDFQWITT